MLFQQIPWRLKALQSTEVIVIDLLEGASVTIGAEDTGVARRQFWDWHTPTNMFLASGNLSVAAQNAN